VQWRATSQALHRGGTTRGLGAPSGQNPWDGCTEWAESVGWVHRVGSIRGMGAPSGQNPWVGHVEWAESVGGTRRVGRIRGWDTSSGHDTTVFRDFGSFTAHWMSSTPGSCPLEVGGPGSCPLDGKDPQALPSRRRKTPGLRPEALDQAGEGFLDRDAIAIRDCAELFVAGAIESQRKLDRIRRGGSRSA
jgi:hypothetical protein